MSCVSLQSLDSSATDYGIRSVCVLLDTFKTMSSLQSVEENALFPREKKTTCLLSLSKKFAEKCMPNLQT